MSASNPTVRNPVVMMKVHKGRVGEKSFGPRGASIVLTALSRDVMSVRDTRSTAQAAIAIASVVAWLIWDLESLKSMGEPLFSAV
jgi:hypothetical protein